MIFKIKEIYLLIFLVLLQSCSGGRIGDFLESSFENSELIEKSEETPNLLGEQKSIVKRIKEEVKEKETLKNNNVLNSDNEKKEQKNTEKRIKEEKEKEILDNKKVLNSEKKLDKIKKVNNVSNSKRKRKNELQSYRIIFILKDVDPRDPIGELSNALKNGRVNFEIEKIERFLDLKK